MTDIAILGAGTVAAVLADGFAASGRTVVVGSRDPRGRASAWHSWHGVGLVGLSEAARSASVVVNATPGRSSLAALRPLRAQLDGKVLIDVANAVEQGPDGFAVALAHPAGSLAQELQRALPGTRVVKTLNTIGPASAMTDPAAFATPPTLFVSGDDADAKRTAAGLLADLGWPRGAIVDLGGIESARLTEAFVLMVGPLVRALGPVPLGLAIAR